MTDLECLITAGLCAGIPYKDENPLVPPKTNPSEKPAKTGEPAKPREPKTSQRDDSLLRRAISWCGESKAHAAGCVVMGGAPVAAAVVLATGTAPITAAATAIVAAVKVAAPLAAPAAAAVIALKTSDR